MERCTGRNDALDFAICIEDQCTHRGEFCHWKWPSKILCFYHYHHLNLLIHFADMTGEQSRLELHEQERTRAHRNGLLVLGTPCDH